MSFLDWANKNINKIPAMVREYAERAYNGTTYCSVIGKHYGLYEDVFGVRKNKKGIFIQKLAVLRENGEGYIRNVYFNEWGMAAGVYSYGYDGKAKYFNYGGSLPYEPVLSPIKDWFKTERLYRECLNVDDVPKLDPSLRYWNYKPYIESMEYVRIYRAYPRQAEMLMRFGYWRMVSMRNCKTLSENPSFHRYLERHHDELSSKPFQTVFNSWKKNPEGSVDDYERSLSYRIECGRKTAFDNKRVYDKLMRFTTQEKLSKWLEENEISQHSYGDYLVACDWLKLDFNDTKVLFPKNFKEMHDLYTKQYGEYEAEQARIEAIRKAKRDAKELATRSQRMLETARKFGYLALSHEGWTVRIAKSKLELIDEGSALHHCVGSMSYDKRQADGESVICFIRKENEPDTPYVTAEVRVTPTQLKVVQRYGDHNRPTPELDDFSIYWMDYANRRYKHAV